ncbi:MAG: coproporphyrinogen III oxidase, partial [Bacteroidales bacterium]|nr:coproporphyrinogen III oxidase [Bacteroidales bacterium]
QGKLDNVDESCSENQFNMLVSMLVDKNYLHYEISNFCKDGFFSRHNTNYWKQVNYLGLGPSAHSYNGYSRQWNIADIKNYMKTIESGIIPFYSEVLDEKMKFNEYLMISLRTMWGVDLEYIEKVFNKEIHDFIVNAATRFIEYGMLEMKNKNTLILTNQGMMISDNIIRELIMP